MSLVLTYDPAVTQCCINTNQKGPFPTLKGLHDKKLPCSMHRLTVRWEPLLQMEEGFQPCRLSCVVGLTWLVWCGCPTCCRQTAPLCSQQREMGTWGANQLSPRSASDLGQVTTSMNAAPSLFWSSDNQRSCRQRSALCSILDYVIQITDVMPKQAHSMVSLNCNMSRAWFCLMLDAPTFP